MIPQEQFGYILNMIKSGKNPQEVVINFFRAIGQSNTDGG